MHSQAPYEYIRDYYLQVHRRMDRYPDVAAFWLAGLRHVAGERVLNVGCGPMLYDYLEHFAESPREYVGLDVNSSCFEFLRRSRDPRLLRAKARTEALGCRVEYLCGDVFDCEEQLSGRFESAISIGFLATLYGMGFERLMRIMHRSIVHGGRLLKITWHGPHRTSKETRDKLRYGFDGPEEPTPDALICGIERAGFALRHNSILECDPSTIGWDAIQVCLFRRTDD